MPSPRPTLRRNRRPVIKSLPRKNSLHTLSAHKADEPGWRKRLVFVTGSGGLGQPQTHKERVDELDWECGKGCESKGAFNTPPPVCDLTTSMHTDQVGM